MFTKGARFYIRVNFSEDHSFVILSNNELEVYKIMTEVNNDCLIATLYSESVQNPTSKIYFKENKISLHLSLKQLVVAKLRKEVQTIEMIPVGVVSMLSRGNLKYKAIDENDQNQHLLIEFSSNGCEFLVYRDNSIILEFASTDGPVGKTNGMARVASGEKKSFYLSLMALVFLGQVQFPVKAPFFHYKDTGQKGILRSESVSHSPNTESDNNNIPKKRTLPQKCPITPPKLNTSMVSPKPAGQSPRELNSLTPRKNATDTPRLQNNTFTPRKSKKKDQATTPLTSKKLHFPSISSSDLSSSPSNNTATKPLLQSPEKTPISPRKQRSKSEVPSVVNLIECWSKLESISGNNDIIS